jgi:hypothetical protein
VIVTLFLADSTQGASPKAEEALRLMPIQKGIEFDRPSAEEAGKCQIAAEKMDGNVGWVVKSPDGVVLRQFVDTNGDNVVDRWCYFQDGL